MESVPCLDGQIIMLYHWPRYHAGDWPLVQHQRKAGVLRFTSARRSGWRRPAIERDYVEHLDLAAVKYERWLPMSQVTFSIPDEILVALKATPDALASRIRFAASVKLYAASLEWLAQDRIGGLRLVDASTVWPEILSVKLAARAKNRAPMTAAAR